MQIDTETKTVERSFPKLKLIKNGSRETWWFGSAVNTE